MLCSIVKSFFFQDSCIWFLNNKVTAELWHETQVELAEVYLYLQKYYRYDFDCWGLFEEYLSECK